MDSLVEANKWRSAFKEVAGLVGFSAAARDPDIQGVLETVQRLKLQGQTMQVSWHSMTYVHGGHVKSVKDAGYPYSFTVSDVLCSHVRNALFQQLPIHVDICTCLCQLTRSGHVVLVLCQNFY